MHHIAERWMQRTRQAVSWVLLWPTRRNAFRTPGASVGGFAGRTKRAEGEFRAALSEKLSARDDPDRPFQTDARDAARAQAERRLCRRIQAQVDVCGRNNVTRTEAYRRVYEAAPELHWALLAHLVSRNGGWSMTDLCGDAARAVFPPQQREDFYLFLERCNDLIFRDAYPQLLLYLYSRRMGRPLFFLLGRLGVSVFMGVAWERFWDSGDSAELTRAMIVNEQSCIEQRVVKTPYYERTVFSRPLFNAQSLLGYAAVVFPGTRRGSFGRPGILGVFVRDFTSIAERISAGKRLYAILFPRGLVRRDVLDFVRRTPHTGSRSDYLPDFFSAVRPRESLGDFRVYSPPLVRVWADRAPQPTEDSDWCVDLSAVSGLFSTPLPRRKDITRRYQRELRLLRRVSRRAQSPGATEDCACEPTGGPAGTGPTLPLPFRRARIPQRGRTFRTRRCRTRAKG